MEATRWRLRQHLLRRHNLTSWNSALRIQRGAPVQPDHPATPAASRVVKDYNKMPTMVKVEYGSEGKVTSQELHVEPTDLWDDTATDVGLVVKQENDMTVKTEDELDEVTFKQELDIGPTVLQPQFTPCPLPPSAVTRSQDPRPSTSSTDGAVPAPSVLVRAQTAQAPRTEAEEEYYTRLYGYPSDVSHGQDLRRIDISNSKKYARTRANEKRYKCEKCEFSTSRKDSLKRHMHTHMKHKPYKCEQCQFSTSRKGDLKRHMYIHMNHKPYKCEQCGYSTSRSDLVKNHMHIHMNYKLYNCDQCEFSTSWKENVKRHMRVHMNYKLYKCEHCEFSTSWKHNLRKHMHIHMTPKPYKCEQCQYSTSHKRDLKNHMDIHMNYKSYKCEQCEYSTNRQSDLKKHVHSYSHK